MSLSQEKIVCIHVVEFGYKRNEVLIDTSIWMDHKSMQRERSQSPKNTYCVMIPTCEDMKWTSGCLQLGRLESKGE